MMATLYKEQTVYSLDYSCWLKTSTALFFPSTAHCGHRNNCQTLGTDAQSLELVWSRCNTLQGKGEAGVGLGNEQVSSCRAMSLLLLLLLLSNRCEPEYEKKKPVLPRYSSGFYYENKVSPKTAFKSNLHGLEEPNIHIHFKEGPNSKEHFSRYKFREENLNGD